jgi:hypothetical protein
MASRAWAKRRQLGSPLDASLGMRAGMEHRRQEGVGLGSIWRLGRLQPVQRLETRRILDTAEQNGIQVMLCLGTYGEFTTGGYFNEGLWNSNPYNAAMGGPCAKPEEFWTNEQARKFYRQRLRYIAARYGARANLFAWEFWNEAYPATPWVAEMAQFLKGHGPFQGNPADPFGHLVSTTYGTPEIWNLPEIDFTQSHSYGEGNLPDFAPLTHNDAVQNRKFNKPHLLAEFGIDWHTSDDKYDAEFQGVNLHNAMWASLLSGNAGGAMIWYWDGYVHPGKLYPQFAALRHFSDQVPWNEGTWKPLQFDPPELLASTEAWRDLSLAPNTPWGTKIAPEFTIDPLEGAGSDPLPSFLYGPWKPELRKPLLLHTNYERPGKFALTVNSVCTSARLQIALDGNMVFEKAFSAVPPEKEGEAPEYESTELRTELKYYQARYNKTYTVDVPAGAHTLSVDITDGDWLSVSAYTFAGYVSERYPRINVYGITNGTSAFLWAQNPEHHWKNVHDKQTIAPVPESKTLLHGLPDGPYQCEWSDPWQTTTVRQERIESKDNALPLNLPTMDADLAVSVRPATP